MQRLPEFSPAVNTQFAPTDILDKFVADLAKSFPAIGDRAVEAASLVRANKVEKLRKLRSVKGDRFLVDGHYCSVKGGYCDCKDKEAPDHKSAKLCAHRVAAMMYLRREQERWRPKVEEGHPADPINRLYAIFQGANEIGCEEVRLSVRVLMTWDKKEEQKSTLEAFLRMGQTRETLHPDNEDSRNRDLALEFDFTFAELHAALIKAGWRYEDKNKSKPGSRLHLYEVWYFRPMTERERKLGGPMSTRVQPIGFSTGT